MAVAGEQGSVKIQSERSMGKTPSRMKSQRQDSSPARVPIDRIAAASGPPMTLAMRVEAWT